MLNLEQLNMQLSNFKLKNKLKGLIQLFLRLRNEKSSQLMIRTRYH